MRFRFDKRWVEGKRIKRVDLSRQHGHSPRVKDTHIERIVFDDKSIMYFSVGEVVGGAGYNILPHYLPARRRVTKPPAN